MLIKRNKERADSIFEIFGAVAIILVILIVIFKVVDLIHYSKPQYPQRLNELDLTNDQWRKLMIEKNFAEYNKVTGVLEWKTNFLQLTNNQER